MKTKLIKPKIPKTFPKIINGIKKKKSKKTNKTQKRILMTDETDVNLSNKLPKTKYIKQKIITRLNKELKIKKFRN